MSHAKATAASIAGAVGTLAAALAPGWSTGHQALIVAVGGAISALIPVVNVLHQLVDQLLSKQVPPQQVEAQAIAAVAGQLGKVDFADLAQKAIASQDVGALVRTELQQLLRSVTPTSAIPPTGGPAPGAQAPSLVPPPAAAA